VVEHDFKIFPELTNAQLAAMPFDSPHEQITYDFEAVVVKVHDGDTVTLRVEFRDFDFPMRFLDIDAPEMNAGGVKARDWLSNEILGEEVMVSIDPKNRVDKWGRLLGRIMYVGLDMGNTMLRLGLVLPFDRRREGEIPTLDKTFSLKWL